MATIFITVSEPFIIRNILRTEFLSRLRAQERDLRVVLVSTQLLSDKLRAEFSKMNCEVEEIKKTTPSTFDRVLEFLSRNLFYTGTNDVMQRRAWYRKESWIPPVCKRVFGKTLGSVPLLRILLRFLERFVSPQRSIEELFNNYAPALVCSTVLMNGEVDVPIVREAKRRGIRTLGMVRSWDNLTGFGYLRIVPDTFIAQNPYIADVAERLQGIPRSITRVIGIPHYDSYLDTALHLSREDFCRPLGLDPQKKILLYGAIGEFLFRNESEMAIVLDRLVQKDVIKDPAQVLFRSHPAFPISTRESLLPHVVFDNGELDSFSHLINSLRHADVLVTAGSTLIIDAACFDTPSISVAFDGITGEKNPWFSCARFFEYFTHLIALRKTAPHLRIATSQDALASEINAYLVDPSRDSSERASIVERFAAPLDGHSGERLAQKIVEILGVFTNRSNLSS